MGVHINVFVPQNRFVSPHLQVLSTKLDLKLFLPKTTTLVAKRIGALFLPPFPSPFLQLLFTANFFSRG